MLKKYVFGFFVFLCGLLSAVHPVPAHAQEPPQIIISEINWAGSALTSADEWLELYNAGPNDVDASGWVLAGAATGSEALALVSGTTISAGGLLVISNYALGEKSTLAVAPNLVTTSLSLPNSGLHIILAEADGTVVDEVSFGSTHKFGSTVPFASAQRDLQTLGWQTTTLSVGLTDFAQLGSPGTVTPTTSTEVTNEPVVEPIVIEPETAEVETPVVEAVEGPITEPATVAQGEVVEETSPEPVIEEVEQETVVEAVETAVDGEVIEAIIEPTQETTIVAETDIVTAAENVIIEEETSVEIEPVVSDVLAVEEVVTEEVVTAPTTNIEAPTVTTTANFSPGAVIITELVSDPVDAEEWIELYNPGSETIDLSAWTVTDASNKKTTLEGSIDAQNFFVVSGPKGKLNNGGDEVNLFDPAGNLIDQVTYGTTDVPAAKKGSSLSLIGSTWLIATASPGQTNTVPITSAEYEEPIITSVATTNATENQPEILPDDQPKSTGDGDDETLASAQTHRVIALAAPVSTPSAKATKKSSGVSKASASTTVSGVVTALPGTFGEQIMMIDGVQVYFYDQAWPALALGDQVTVRGVRSENRGEPRIKIQNANDIKVTGSSSLEATSLGLGEFSQAHEGQLVTIEGEIEEINGDRLILFDAGNRATVIAYEKTGVSWSKIDGVKIRVTGVARIIDGEVRLYPRTQSDVKTVHDEAVVSALNTDQNISRATGWSTYLAYGLLFGTLSALGYWFARRHGATALKISTATIH